MEYFCQRELDFALALFERLRIPVHRLRADDPLAVCDGGLRKLLGMEADYRNAVRIAAHWSRERTVYKLADRFQCRYVYFRLPRTEPAETLVLGPFLTEDLSQEQLLEMAEGLHIPMQLLPQMANHYASMPICQDPATILSVVYTLGDALWEGKGFNVVDVEEEQRERLPANVTVDTTIEQEYVLQQMQQMEERYAYEDRLMAIVAKGLTSQAELLLSSVSKLNFQQRTADTLRNQKNYCIICNTLLRKAAQQGGVHPFHIDRMSSRFARMIENTSTPEKCSALIGEMAKAYCHLVHEQTRTQVSSIVQKVRTYIDANLSGDLSLTTLAQLMKITPSYLSSLFHEETGITLAMHITQVRMKAALHLFRTTRLQIQTVAQLCGFGDPNYFSKRFKKYFGITPQQYRQGQAVSVGQQEE